jgi:hypothetical protein
MLVVDYGRQVGHSHHYLVAQLYLEGDLRPREYVLGYYR